MTYCSHWSAFFPLNSILAKSFSFFPHKSWRTSVISSQLGTFCGTPRTPRRFSSAFDISPAFSQWRTYNSWTSRNEESRTTRRTFSDSTYETGPHLPVSWGSSVVWCSNVEEKQMPRGEEGNGKLRVTNVTFGFAGIFPAWWKQGDAQPFWFCLFCPACPESKPWKGH